MRILCHKISYIKVYYITKTKINTPNWSIFPLSVIMLYYYIFYSIFLFKFILNKIFYFHKFMVHFSYKIVSFLKQISGFFFNNFITCMTYTLKYLPTLVKLFLKYIVISCHDVPVEAAVNSLKPQHFVFLFLKIS